MLFCNRIAARGTNGVPLWTISWLLVLQNEANNDNQNSMNKLLFGTPIEVVP